MPEEIKPIGELVRPRVDTGRPGDTGLGALSRALTQVNELGISIAQRAAKKELEEVENQLSTPGLTIAEAEEIQEEATFPLARIQAANRRGGLVVEAAQDDIQDILDKEPDVVAARRKLREHQESMMPQARNDAERAGIREAYAKLAPRMLADASARRVAARDAEAQRVQSDSFKNAIEFGGPETVVNRLLDDQFDTEVASGDVEALQTTFLESVSAYWKSGDNEELDVNVNVDKTVKALDLFLDNGSMGSTIRKATETLRDQILTKQQADVNDPLKGLNAAMDREHAQITELVNKAQLENPYSTVDPDLAIRWVETARTAARKDAVTAQILEMQTQGPPVRTVVEMKEVTQPRALLLTALKKEGAVEIDEIGIAAMQEFDQTMALLDPKLQNEPGKVSEIAFGLVKQLSKEVADRAVEKRKTDAQVKDEVYEKLTAARVRFAKQNPGVSMPLPTEAEIEQWIEVRRDYWNEEFNNRYRKNLQELGVKPEDVVGVRFKR